MSKLGHRIRNSESVRSNSPVWMVKEFACGNQPKFQTCFSTTGSPLCKFQALDLRIVWKSPTSLLARPFQQQRETKRHGLDGRRMRGHAGTPRRCHGKSSGHHPLWPMRPVLSNSDDATTSLPTWSLCSRLMQSCCIWRRAREAGSTADWDGKAGTRLAGSGRRARRLAGSLGWVGEHGRWLGWGGNLQFHAVAIQTENRISCSPQIPSTNICTSKQEIWNCSPFQFLC
jgi:hypothetical protein